MVNSIGRTIFLTGAPTSSSLEWTEHDLCAGLQPCFLRNGTLNQYPRPTPEEIAPLWRSLPFKQVHLPTGLTQGSREIDPSVSERDVVSETSFFTASDVSFVTISPDGNESRSFQGPSSETEGILSQFYEHSFAVHEDIPSSQIINAGSIEDASFDTDIDRSTVDIINDEPSSLEQMLRLRLASGLLSDLRDIPNAAYLRSISPQTMTVSLVVGIISISPPRKIRTRKGGRTVELIEMLVGDDTRAGFSINIWLPCLQERKAPVQGTEELRSSTSRVRSRDVILARHIALSSFRGKVHGQSLRKGMTTIDLLHQLSLDTKHKKATIEAETLDRNALGDPQLLKVKNVSDWVMQFVGNVEEPSKPDNRTFAGGKTTNLQVLPADTP